MVIHALILALRGRGNQFSESLKPTCLQSKFQSSQRWHSETLSQSNSKMEGKLPGFLLPMFPLPFKSPYPLAYFFKHNYSHYVE